MGSFLSITLFLTHLKQNTMKRLKISQGEFEVRDEITRERSGEFAVRNRNDFQNHVGTFYPYVFYDVTYDQAKANAELFCDAINTANKLNKLPSELAADRELLLNALRRAIPCIAIRKEMEDAEAVIKQIEE